MSTSEYDRESIVDPIFTVQELRDSIPPHCFDRNTFTSLRYLLMDNLLVLSLLYIGVMINKLEFPVFFEVIIWSAYSMVQVC